MTDAEKELRRLAQAIRDAMSDDYRLEERTQMFAEFYGQITVAKVLALLDRIEALEKQAAQNGRLASDASDDVDTLIRRVEAAEEKEHAAEERAKAAERKGAEEMREKAAMEIDDMAGTTLTPTGIVKIAARCIRSLPLPGDAP